MHLVQLISDEYQFYVISKLTGLKKLTNTNVKKQKCFIV